VEAEKQSKEKQNAKHKKGTFLNWFDMQSVPALLDFAAVLR
jgi:hypothetical protein